MKEYLFQLILSGATIVLTAIVRIVVYKLVQRYGKMNPKIEHRARHINRVLSNMINFAGLLIIIGIWGVNTKNLFLALSSLFAIIGAALFAQWSILSNVTAGMIIFFTSLFRIGDRIRVEDKDLPLEGVIEDILTFNTHIRTDDGRLHIYPNSLFLQKSISRAEE